MCVIDLTDVGYGSLRIWRHRKANVLKLVEILILKSPSVLWSLRIFSLATCQRFPLPRIMALLIPSLPPFFFQSFSVFIPHFLFLFYGEGFSYHLSVSIYDLGSHLLFFKGLLSSVLNKFLFSVFIFLLANKYLLNISHVPIILVSIWLFIWVVALCHCNFLPSLLPIPNSFMSTYKGCHLKIFFIECNTFSGDITKKCISRWKKCVVTTFPVYNIKSF